MTGCSEGPEVDPREREDVREVIHRALDHEPELRLEPRAILSMARRRQRVRRHAGIGGVAAAVAGVALGATLLTGPVDAPGMVGPADIGRIPTTAPTTTPRVTTPTTPAPAVRPQAPPTTTTESAVRVPTPQAGTQAPRPDGPHSAPATSRPPGVSVSPTTTRR